MHINVLEFGKISYFTINEFKINVELQSTM